VDLTLADPRELTDVAEGLGDVVNSISREHLTDPIQRSWLQRAVRMKEEQHLTVGCGGPNTHRRSATGGREERADLVTGNIERSVLASAIDHDYLVIRALLTDRV
jgi:hypothetical protein